VFNLIKIFFRQIRSLSFFIVKINIKSFYLSLLCKTYH